MNQPRANDYPRIFAPFLATPFESSFCLLILFWSLWFFNQSGDSLFLIHLMDSGHAVVFFVSTYLLIKALSTIPKPIFKRPGMLCGSALFIGLVTGMAIEMIQPYFGRSASFLDLWYDLLGSGAACLVLLARTQHLKRSLKVSLAGAAALLLSVAALRPGYYFWVEAQQAKALPSLFDFEQNWQREYIAANPGGVLRYTLAPSAWGNNDSMTLQLTLSNAPYPGVRLHHLPSKWGGFQNLYFEVFSKHEEAFELVIRVHDKSHDHAETQSYEDRFNQRLQVRPGLNIYQIKIDDIENAPKHRQMDLDEISTLILFALNPDTTRNVYLDNLRLE